MKKLTSTFSINQKPKPDDLIVSINTKKEILFNKKTKSFLHILPKEYQKVYNIPRKELTARARHRYLPPHADAQIGARPCCPGKKSGDCQMAKSG